MNQPLTPAVFHILLALSLKERHGYELMKQVEEDSGGHVSLGPGTLYTAIGRLLEDGWIAVSNAKSNDERRKYYRLTKKGQSVLADETKRLAEAAHLAASRLKIRFPRPA